VRPTLEFLRGAVRPLLCLAVGLTVCAGFWADKLTSEQFLTIATLIVGFFFVSRQVSKP